MSENNQLDKDDLEGSRYLYADKNKDLYLNTFKNKRCPQSNKVFLLLDRDDSEQKLKSLTDHVAQCDVCREQLKKQRSYAFKIDELIPRPTVPRSLQVEFESELAQLIKDFSFTAKPVPSDIGFWSRLKTKFLS